MVLDRVISYVSENRNEYLIKFEEFHDFNSFGVPIVDVSLVIASSRVGDNTLKDLFYISELILDYIKENDIILYYYCDHQEVNRRNESITPQKYRSLLFNTLFNKKSTFDLIKKEVIISDEENGDHFISLITKNHNEKVMLHVINELEKFKK